jgi:hypothetical protein
METKFLRLRSPVELGCLFGDWRVCWLGGWAKHRMHYLVMLVRIGVEANVEETPPGREGSAALGRVTVTWARGGRSDRRRCF